MKKKVQLVLGSGGARGIAHIGVIQRLLEDDYEIVEIVGCSMGAVVGGMYSAGHLEAYTEWLLKQSKTDVYRLFDITFSLHGLVKGDRIFQILEEMAGKHDIEKLKIPFTAIATDMHSRTEVHFNEGNLFKALRASTGIPGVFTPIADSGRLYVDGAVLNPLPVDVLHRRKDASIIAINLNGAIESDIIAIPQPQPPDEEKAPDFWTRIKSYFEKAQDDAAEKKEPETIETKAEDPVPVTVPTFSMFELLSASYDASLDKLAAMTLRENPVDMIIEIPRNTCSVFEFYRAAELIEVGRKQYDKAMAKQKRED